jgi:hypothetical protein
VVIRFKQKDIQYRMRFLDSLLFTSPTLDFDTAFMLFDSFSPFVFGAFGELDFSKYPPFLSFPISSFDYSCRLTTCTFAPPQIIRRAMMTVRALIFEPTSSVLNGEMSASSPCRSLLLSSLQACHGLPPF